MESYGSADESIAECEIHNELDNVTETDDETIHLMNIKIRCMLKTKMLAVFSKESRSMREDIRSFLSRKNVLPQYGFPADTVEMSVPEKQKEPQWVFSFREICLLLYPNIPPVHRLLPITISSDIYYS